MTRAQSTDGSTVSAWISGEDVPRTDRLRGDLEVDVCVVGAGIAGLSIAYELIRRGRSVTVIDAGEIGGGQSGRTTAHLCSALDDHFYELQRLHGVEGARLAAESHAAAIDRIQEIVITEGISCDFERIDGYLFLAPGHSQEMLEREHEAASRAGLLVDRVGAAPLPFSTGPCLRFRDQGQFHPLRYLVGLARAVIAGGGMIYTGTHIDTIDGSAPARLHTDAGNIVRADHVVVASNVPFNDRTVMHTKQAPYRTYVIGAAIPRGSVPVALYWDTLDPYHYVRLQEGEEHDLLIVGGEDHKTGQDDHPERRWDRLEIWTRERFPMVTDVRFRWSGQVIEPVDGMAFIGRNPLDGSNVYIVTGDSGHGMTHGAIAGMLIPDLIEGRENRWSALYDPRRRTLRSAGEYLKENLNVARQYGDWLKSGDVEDADQIPRGEGAVIRRGLQLIAAYVDGEGVTHACSAVCTHLGGIVRWNTAEKTWDCPCHGSRFSPTGEVVEGPAMTGLAPLPGSRLKRTEKKATIRSPASSDHRR